MLWLCAALVLLDPTKLVAVPNYHAGLDQGRRRDPVTGVQWWVVVDGGGVVTVDGPGRQWSRMTESGGRGC